MAASWLPVISEHPAVVPMTWQLHRKILTTKSILAILLTSLLQTSLVIGVRYWGYLQASELHAIDDFMQLRSQLVTKKPDERFQLHNNGEIWRYIGTSCSGSICSDWQQQQQLDNNSATAAITAAGNQLYQLHNDGKIWRYTGVPCSGGICSGWQQLDNNSATAAITATGNQLYQLHNDGKIWLYTGTPCSKGICSGWQLLDNNSATAAITGSSPSFVTRIKR